MLHLICFLILGLVGTELQCAETLSSPGTRLPLWPSGAPGAKGNAPADIPTLAIHLPVKPNGAGMLLIPGGSYEGIYEGQADPFARWLNDQGITAFVLRYRLGSAGYRYPSQLQDAVQAMRTIRANANRWGVMTNRIGAMGFSAGGHLVSTLIDRPEDGERDVSSAWAGWSSRPDVAVLCYPVISMIQQPHRSSREHLIGTEPSEALVRLTSSEWQVHAGLPPCFVWHTAEDRLVPAIHSKLYVEALERSGVPYEFHLYQRGDHGTGLMGTDHPWRQDLLYWLKGQSFVP